MAVEWAVSHFIIGVYFFIQLSYRLHHVLLKFMHESIQQFHQLLNKASQRPYPVRVETVQNQLYKIIIYVSIRIRTRAIRKLFRILWPLTVWSGLLDRPQKTRKCRFNSFCVVVAIVDCIQAVFLRNLSFRSYTSLNHANGPKGA